MSWWSVQPPMSALLYSIVVSSSQDELYFDLSIHNLGLSFRSVLYFVCDVSTFARKTNESLTFNTFPLNSNRCRSTDTPVTFSIFSQRLNIFEDASIEMSLQVFPFKLLTRIIIIFFVWREGKQKCITYVV